MSEEEKKAKAAAEKKAADDKAASEKKAADEKKVADDKKKDKDEKEHDPVPYNRFKEVNDENRTLAAENLALQKAEDERKESEAKEAGKFEELYIEEKGKREKIEADGLKSTVALEKGLPADFVKRLQGEDREALEADADALLEMIGDASKNKKGIKDSSSKKSDAEVLEIDDMTPAEIREKKNELFKQSG